MATGSKHLYLLWRELEKDGTEKGLLVFTVSSVLAEYGNKT